ncbi:MAG: ABC transporter permease [Parvibaculaceae bacterium]|nr:ABC transporter permease [Parvibaculaceae bacterium]
MFDLHGYGEQLFLGVIVTLELAFVSLFFGVLFGILGASAKLSSARALSVPVSIFTNLMRGVPEFVIILVSYFGLTNLLTSIVGSYVEIDPFVAGVFALSLVFSSYASENFRGAFLAVPKGQLEAARAYGMNRSQIFLRIHLPQAWRFALPSLNNQWQSLLKDTSLISVIGLEDLMRKAMIASQVTKNPFTFYVATAVVYFVLLAISVPLFRALEKRANRGVRRN